MKRRGLLAGIAALAALAVCLILFWLAPVRTRAEGELVLWYAGTDCPAEGMDALAARCEKETGLHVEAVGFPDENALADAFAEGRPDLLWCSHVRAYDIDEGEGLVALPETVSRPAQSVEGFFPLGARLPVLLRSGEHPVDRALFCCIREERNRAADELFIESGALNPQKARVLLRLCLTKTTDAAEIARTFAACR